MEQFSLQLSIATIISSNTSFHCQLFNMISMYLTHESVLWWHKLDISGFSWLLTKAIKENFLPFHYQMCHHTCISAHLFCLPLSYRGCTVLAPVWGSPLKEVTYSMNLTLQLSPLSNHLFPLYAISLKHTHTRARVRAHAHIHTHAALICL